MCWSCVVPLCKAALLLCWLWGLWLLITHSARSHGPLAITLLISASLNGENSKRIKDRVHKWDTSSFSETFSMPLTEMLVQGFQAGTGMV